MKTFWQFVVFLPFVLSISLVAAPNMQLSNVSDDYTRMGRYCGKIANQEPITIVFLGTSITRGGVVNFAPERYSSQTVAELNTIYANVIAEVNAGVQGDTVFGGWARLQEDVLNYSPDLVIVELNVNYVDPTIEAKRTYENIIRTLLMNNIPVVSLYMQRLNAATQQEWQSQISRYYRIPEVSFRDYAAPLVDNGTYTWAQLLVDDVHPGYLGHDIITELLVNALTKCPGRTSQAPIPPRLFEEQ